MKSQKNILKKAVIILTISLLFISTISVTANTDEKKQNKLNYDDVLELRFYQMNFNFDGTIYEDTDWGSVDLLYVGQDPIMYFNLALNGEWQIQNIPVLSHQGVDVDQYMTYYFDLGNEMGEEVNSIGYGYAFTEDIILSKPDEFYTAPVEDDLVELSSGIQGVEMPDLIDAKKLVGDEVSSTKKHAHKNFPNQECGKNECAPAAVSNSLKFLNQKYKLGLTDAQTSIAEMKKATKWKNGCGIKFWEDKKKYMEDNNYSITTRKMTDMDKIIEELDAGQDIEIIETWNNGKSGHATCLIGATKLKNGKYSLDVSDDRKQGQAGGTNKPRTYLYDPKTGNINESGFISKFEYAIVECPKLPKWTYHFKYPSCPGGTLKVYGTHNCIRLEPPLFNKYAKQCNKYQGYIPKKINDKEVNDIIFDFNWDYWCKNEEHIKFVSPKWEGSQEKWVLTSVPYWIEANINEEFKIPSVGDSSGEIRNIYCIVNLDVFLASPTPPLDEYLVINGECDELPGYLIGTTPIEFNPNAGPDENPFSTTPLEYYVLVNDGEITFLPVANQAPYSPKIDGQPAGKPGTIYEYSIVTTDPEVDNVYYNINWGDGNTELIGPYVSGEEVTATHSWPNEGTFILKANAEDVFGDESEWSEEFEISIPRMRISNFNFYYGLFYPFTGLVSILKIIFNRLG